MRPDRCWRSIARRSFTASEILTCCSSRRRARRWPASRRRGTTRPASRTRQRLQSPLHVLARQREVAARRCSAPAPAAASSLHRPSTPTNRDDYFLSWVELSDAGKPVTSARVGGRRAEKLKSGPSFFEADRHCKSSQYEATLEGRHARSPTSQVARKDLKPDRPTRRCSTATAASRSRCEPAYSGDYRAPLAGARRRLRALPTSAAAASSARSGTRRR